MTLPKDEDFLKAEMKEFRDVMVEAEERHQRNNGRRAADHDWRRWLSEHLPAFFAVMGLMAMALGALGGRVLSNSEREHEEFRAAIVALQSWRSELSAERAAERYRVVQFTAMAQDTSNRLNELLPHLYASLRADARDRGDTTEVVKLDKKLKAAITAAKASGQ